MEEVGVLEQVWALSWDTWPAVVLSLGALVMTLTALFKKLKPIWTKDKKVVLTFVGFASVVGASILELFGVGYLGAEGVTWYPHVVGIALGSLIGSGLLYDKALPIAEVFFEKLKRMGEEKKPVVSPPAPPPPTA